MIRKIHSFQLNRTKIVSSNLDQFSRFVSATRKTWRYSDRPNFSQLVENRKQPLYLFDLDRNKFKKIIHFRATTWQETCSIYDKTKSIGGFHSATLDFFVLSFCWSLKSDRKMMLTDDIFFSKPKIMTRWTVSTLITFHEEKNKQNRIYHDQRDDLLQWNGKHRKSNSPNRKIHIIWNRSIFVRFQRI